MYSHTWDDEEKFRKFEKSTTCQNTGQNNLQLTFKRLAQAYNAASEDPRQSSFANSNTATPQTAEFFDLSP